ncbi:hypothetical protein Acr_00g0089450 [Actinidia rufa]|uniref:Uncharacterized protein n=1 Tax=Actinidia rufa TaxID=165716 RepID=A0A7J0DWY6_9ERIC|nr:hypothetical protein Acr_00g0089450 [Actinidia rufa]
MLVMLGILLKRVKFNLSISSPSSLVLSNSSNEVKEGDELNQIVLTEVAVLEVAAFAPVPTIGPILGGGAKTSSKAAYIAPKPRALSKKRPQAMDHVVGVQVFPFVHDPILALPNPNEAESSFPSSHFLRKMQGEGICHGSLQEEKVRGVGSSVGTFSPFDTPELWNPKFASIKLRRQVTMADTLKDHETCLALGSVRMKKYSSEAKKALKKTNNLDSDLKKAKEKLTIEEALDCLKKLGTPAYPATWTVAAPEVELLDLPEAYLPLILLGFNEEKYMTHQAKEGDENTIEVDGTGTSNELGARGDTNRSGEDQIIPPKV